MATIFQGRFLPSDEVASPGGVQTSRVIARSLDEIVYASGSTIYTAKVRARAYPIRWHGPTRPVCCRFRFLGLIRMKSNVVKEMQVCLCRLRLIIL
jgi:hypothetical protein